jgi:hypothetical protein
MLTEAVVMAVGEQAAPCAVPSPAAMFKPLKPLNEAKIIANSGTIPASGL